MVKIHRCKSGCDCKKCKRQLLQYKPYCSQPSTSSSQDSIFFMDYTDCLDDKSKEPEMWLMDDSGDFQLSQEDEKQTKDKSKPTKKNKSHLKSNKSKQFINFFGEQTAKQNWSTLSGSLKNGSEIDNTSLSNTNTDVDKANFKKTFTFFSQIDQIEKNKIVEKTHKTQFDFKKPYPNQTISKSNAVVETMRTNISEGNKTIAKKSRKLVNYFENTDKMVLDDFGEKNSSKQNRFKDDYKKRILQSVQNNTLPVKRLHKNDDKIKAKSLNVGIKTNKLKLKKILSITESDDLFFSQPGNMLSANCNYTDSVASSDRNKENCACLSFDGILSIDSSQPISDCLSDKSNSIIINTSVLSGDNNGDDDVLSIDTSQFDNENDFLIDDFVDHSLQNQAKLNTTSKYTNLTTNQLSKKEISNPINILSNVLIKKSKDNKQQKERKRKLNNSNNRYNIKSTKEIKANETIDITQSTDEEMDYSILSQRKVSKTMQSKTFKTSLASMFCNVDESDNSVDEVNSNPTIRQKKPKMILDKIKSKSIDEVLNDDIDFKLPNKRKTSRKLKAIVNSQSTNDKINFSQNSPLLIPDVHVKKIKKIKSKKVISEISDFVDFQSFIPKNVISKKKTKSKKKQINTQPTDDEMNSSQNQFLTLITDDDKKKKKTKSNAINDKLNSERKCMNNKHAKTSREHIKDILRISQSTDDDMFPSQNSEALVILNDAKNVKKLNKTIYNLSQKTNDRMDTLSLNSECTVDIFNNVQDIIKSSDQFLSTITQRYQFNETSVELSQAFTNTQEFLQLTNSDIVDSEENMDTIINSHMNLPEDRSVEVLAKQSNIEINISDEHYTKINSALDEIYKDQSLFYHGPEFKIESYEKKKVVLLEKIKTIFHNLAEDVDNERPLILKYRNTIWKNTVMVDGCVSLKPSSAITLSKVNKNHKGSLIKFRIIIYILKKIYNMAMMNTTCNKRELYYEIVNFVKNEVQVTSATQTVSLILNIPVWDLGIFSTSKGLVHGDLKIYFKNNVVSFNAQGGTLIPQDIRDISKVESNAHFILIVEKDAIFQKLLNENVNKKLSRPFLLVTGKGFPDYNTRLLLKTIWKLLSIPVFIMVDGDPYGIEIMFNYRFGALKSSNVADHLAMPNIRWLGVHPSEVGILNIKSQALTQNDIRKINSMLKRPYIDFNPAIKEELVLMLKKKFKVEIEALIKHNNFISNSYLPHKICSMRYL